MKKYFFILAAMIVTLVSSCVQKELPADITFETNPKSLYLKGEGDNRVLNVKTNSPSWKVTTTADWLTISPMEGSMDTGLTVVAAENKTGEKRFGTITLKDNSGFGYINIAVAQVLPGEEPNPENPPVPGPGEEEEVDNSSLVIPKSAFTIKSAWSVTGSIMGLNWKKDLEMLEELDNGWIAAFDVEVGAGEEFKFRKDADWDSGDLGAGRGVPEIDKRYKLADKGGNFKLPSGKYDLYIQPNFMLLYVLNSGATFTHGDAVAKAEETENVRIYVLNNSTWRTPYLYAYAAGGSLQPNGAWPGTYAAGTKQYGDYTWTYWEASGFSGVNGINFILNNGSVEQYPAPDEEDPLLSNLTIHNTMYLVWDGAKVTQVDDPSQPGVTGTGIEPDKMEFGSSSWTIIGTLGGTKWDYDFPMDTEGYWEVAREVSISAGEQFKFRQNRKWESNLGFGEYSDTEANLAQLNTKLSLVSGAGNIKLASSGSYDIYLCVENRIAYILPAGAEWTHEADGKPDFTTGGNYDPNMDPSKKASGLTYQVNVFSFKDSNGDGYGDFQGIISELDYFDKLGVTALWLSPIQPAQSYHGYDVTDYEAVNKAFGTEADFQELINKAHQHNIRIYMDYVINHSGDQNKWFLDVKDNGTKSPYWNYYSLSKNPEADIKAGKIAQVPSSFGFNQYKWFPVTIGGGGKHHYKIDLDWTNSSAPTMTVTETTAAPTTSGTYNNPPRYLYWDNGTSCL